MNRRWGFYLTLVAMTLFALGVGGLNFLYRLRVKPGLDTQIELQNRYKSLYEEDIAFLAKSATELSLAASGGTSDAGPYLNPLVVWIPGAATKPIVDSTTRIALMRTGGDWILQIAKGRRPRTNLAFFSELSKFDYWDIERGSPIAGLIEKKEFVPPTRLPLPDTSDLVTAAKLRLIVGGLDKDFRPALRDARALGRLMMSTENIQLMLAGLLILDYERRAYRYYTDELKMDVKAWEPIDANVTRRARRAILATRAYLRLWTPLKTMQEFFLEKTIPPGFCAAINEAIPFDYSLRGLLEPHWPFEMDTRKEYERLDQIFGKAQTVCRVRYLTALTRDRRLKIKVPGPILFNDLPYSRKIFGLRLSATDLGGFEAYGKQLGGEPAAD
jgi:hypothetical protein